jgi:hypothetical protein
MGHWRRDRRHHLGFVCAPISADVPSSAALHRTVGAPSPRGRDSLVPAVSVHRTWDEPTAYHTTSTHPKHHQHPFTHPRGSASARPQSPTMPPHWSARTRDICPVIPASLVLELWDAWSIASASTHISYWLPRITNEAPQRAPDLPSLQSLLSCSTAVSAGGGCIHSLWGIILGYGKRKTSHIEPY